MYDRHVTANMEAGSHFEGLVNRNLPATVSTADHADHGIERVGNELPR